MDGLLPTSARLLSIFAPGVAFTKREAAAAAKVSITTVQRALKFLVISCYAEALCEGGGKGKQSVYRILHYPSISPPAMVRVAGLLYTVIVDETGAPQFQRYHWPASEPLREQANIAAGDSAMESKDDGDE